MTTTKITESELTSATVKNLLIGKKSFQICGVTDLSKCAVLIEGEIENLNLSCRIYTEYRTAALAGEVFLGGVGLIAAAAIAAHNLATFNPDYEIGKNKINSTVSVIYKK